MRFSSPKGMDGRYALAYLSKWHLHENMRDICLFKNVSDGMEAETFVEGDGGDLGMEAEGASTLAAGFGEEGVHETGSEALMADSG